MGLQMPLNEMQIKNTLQSGEKGTLLHCWWECKLVWPPWKTMQKFLKKLKIGFPCGPPTALPGIYPDRAIIQKDACTHTFIAALSTTAKTWKQPQCP